MEPKFVTHFKNIIRAERMRIANEKTASKDLYDFYKEKYDGRYFQTQDDLFQHKAHVIIKNDNVEIEFDEYNEFSISPAIFDELIKEGSILIVQFEG